MFRSGNGNEFHIVGIHSTGFWFHRLRTGDVDTERELAAKYSTQINTDLRGGNHLRIIAKGTEGWLFIGETFVDVLDLSGLSKQGSVHAVGSYFREDAIRGKSTRFEDFTIRRLTTKSGPLKGRIQHEIHKTGFIDTHNPRVSIADGIIEASFVNPYASWQGEWSSGFLMRSNKSDEFHVILVQESGTWHHHLRSGDVDATQRLAERYSSQISTANSGSNHIRVIALGSEGWLFINGVYIDELDLSGLTQPGEVSAVTNYFTGDGLSGYSTRFEDFTIWSADGR